MHGTHQGKGNVGPSMAQPPTDYAKVSCSEKHCVALSHAGRAFTWALTASGNRFGQLCRGVSPPGVITDPAEVDIGQRVVSVGAGGGRTAGHTALVGEDGSVFMCGCDRWQQLGLSSEATGVEGSTGGYVLGPLELQHGARHVAMQVHVGAGETVAKLAAKSRRAQGRYNIQGCTRYGSHHSSRRQRA